MPDPLGPVEALRQIAHLCEMMAEAYPTSIFPEPPEELRAKDGIAADVLRSVACPQFAEAAAIARAALTALPAPEGLSPTLTEGERLFVRAMRAHSASQLGGVWARDTAQLVAIIDRLSPSTEEGTC